jgi:4-hydroxybenzoate polyprenyltransferase
MDHRGREGVFGRLWPDRAPEIVRARSLEPVARLLRPHQWIKNLFVAAPLFFTPEAVSTEAVLRVLAGIACFCLLASAVYVMNDYADREADSRHPVKCLRPIACGEVSLATARLLLAGLLAVGMVASFTLSVAFGALAALYFVQNLAYSLGLKNLSIVDVLVITLGFVIRVYAGAVLIGVVPSAWIIVCTGLLALFLALGKRRDDLVRSLDDGHRRSLEGYSKHFLDTAISITLGALLVSYITYTTDETVMVRFGSQGLFLTVPFVVAGIFRYLQIVLVEERSGSPTKIVTSDPFLIGCLALWALTFIFLIHV